MEKELNLKTAELEKISHLDYFKIAISVDCVIFGYENKELKLLLIKSDLEEFAGLYSLLGDLIRPDEDLETASYRILKERTSTWNRYMPLAVLTVTRQAGLLLSVIIRLLI